MRFLFGLCAAALVVACSGASSNELFGRDSREPSLVTEDASSTEPPPEPPGKEPVAPNGPDAPPVEKRDAAPDAKPDVVDASTPVKCDYDSECTVDDEVCNWKTDTCAAPGPIGAPCKRDLECQEDLCNWKLTKCSDPAPTGTPCRRNKECASGWCSETSICE